MEKNNNDQDRGLIHVWLIVLFLTIIVPFLINLAFGTDISFIGFVMDVFDKMGRDFSAGIFHSEKEGEGAQNIDSLYESYY